MTIRVTVDREQCVGSASCVRWLPEVFALDAEGLAYVVDATAAAAALVTEVADACPTAAIVVEGADD